MKIQGVLGGLDTQALGQTLMHEHVSCADWSMRMNFGARFFEYDKVLEMAVGQFNKAKALGVRTVVDGTPVNLGRDARLIRDVAERTGLNFIASSGFYYQEEPWLAFRDGEQIYDLLMGECADGIAGTGVKPGILKAGVGRAGLTPCCARCSPPRGGWRRRPACPSSATTTPRSETAGRSWTSSPPAACPSSG